MEKREIEGKALFSIVRYGLRAVLDLLIPRKCIVCEKTMEISEKHLCRKCLEDLPRTYYWLRKFNPMADRFNALIQEDLENPLNNQSAEAILEDLNIHCGDDITNNISSTRTDYAYAAALFFYRAENNYSQISRELKYHGDIPAGEFFGQKLGQVIAAGEHFSDVDAVIPVPLHWTRKWSRGYNQAEVIAREVAATLGAELRTDILERCRRTHTQTKLTIEGKAANVQGAFRVCPDLLDSQPRPCESSSNRLRPCFKKAGTSDPSGLKHLLLIDDVFTTGSTIHACYQALRSVFPPSVRISVATLAFVGEG